MPTRAEIPRPSSSTYQATFSWTDDLPVCKNTGVGYSTNQIYREDGHRLEEHPFEDTSFHCCYNDSTFLYAVFDGHEGVEAARFALQRLAAELLLLGDLSEKNTDEEIKDLLRQAFIAVERSYLETLDDKVVERTVLQYEIPEGLTSYEAYRTYPQVVDKLNTLNTELSCGTSAVVALIKAGRLFVANVGDSRALLCKTDPNGVLRVVQLSVDHDLTNEDELLRLYNLGLRIERTHGCRLGNQDNTRCIGNYLVKGGYKEFEELACADEEPIIAEPEIHGGIQLDESCRFLLLMSDGLYKSLEEATGTDQVNKDIAQLAAAEFRVQSTLTGVAQAVVDRVVRLHHDMYMSGSGKKQSKRDDITLLVRNFNYYMPNAHISPLAQHGATNITTSTQDHNQINSGMNDSTTTTSTTNRSYRTRTIGTHIAAYVDFTEFNANVEAARRNGTLPPDIEF